MASCVASAAAVLCAPPAASAMRAASESRACASPAAGSAGVAVAVRAGARRLNYGEHADYDYLFKLLLIGDSGTGMSIP